MRRAIVFAYHDVGVRCLRVLIDAGVDVALVVTHQDAPGEAIWFDSVAELAQDAGLNCVMPADPHDPALVARARELAPDLLFSFYYRHMLRREWLELPALGAFNMHGSLLPKFRGRAPVNWAILHGARETGATLHRMNEKPDNGAIVDQCAVPILGDDTAREVFRKVTVAAEIVLARSLPDLLAGTQVERPQQLSLGRYYGGRRPEDGRIPRDANVRQIHDMVRALAPPYPCAFVQVLGQRVLIERTRREATDSSDGTAAPDALQMASDGSALWLQATDGQRLRVLAARCEGDARQLDARAFEKRFGSHLLRVDA